MIIVSASRRTDIPAFHGEWFRECLDRGYAEYPNPFSKAVCRVSLRPEDVIGFVFWSKNFIPFMPVLDELRRRGYRFYCLFTITGLDHPVEQRLPPLSDRVACFKAIAATHGADRIAWRFDPIVALPGESPPFSADRFRLLCDLLAGSTVECITSFVQFYPKVRRRMRTMPVTDPDIDAKRATMAALADHAVSCGMQLNVCCQDNLVCGTAGKAHCVDIDRFRRMTDAMLPDVPRKGTRKECGCSASRDIGTYSTCRHDCAYCYANA